MKKHEQGVAPIHPLAWVAGIAVILASAVGIGVGMGWIPTSTTHESVSPTMAERQSADTAAKTGFPEPTKEHTSEATAKPAHTTAKPAAQTRTSTASTTTTTTTNNAPLQVLPSSQAGTGGTATPRCAECGVVASVRDVETKGAGSGLGAVGGAVLGGVLGNQVGAGRGQDVATVVGAVGGGLAGNEIEKRVKSTKSHVVTIRFDDGSTRDINTASDSNWRAGDKVKVVDGVIRSNS
jgi:outer membrane lipoprotein SlyB